MIYDPGIVLADTTSEREF